MKTFGTNSDAVNGVIERASRLTEAEAEKLEAACNAAQNFAWAAAEDDAHWPAAWSASRRSEVGAAMDAAWDAALASAGDSAGDLAWVAARVAASIVAHAASARDLISDDHYQNFAGPWESVMGPVFKENGKKEKEA